MTAPTRELSRYRSIITLPFAVTSTIDKHPLIVYLLLLIFEE
ncbi:MAG: hypothetical protein ACFB14_24370 [Leptolyngbyaceae cyanobacterium]